MYTFVNGQPADATQVNKNFDDIIAGVGDLSTLRPTIASLGAVATGDPRLSDARVASDVSAWAKAETKPSYTYTEVGAPSTSGARLSDARPASDVYAWAKAASAPAGGIASYVAGDTLLNANDTEGSTTEGSYAKRKSVQVPLTGTYRVKFDIKIGAGATNAYGKIYVNDVSLGTERINTTDSYITYSQDFLLGPGSTISLWTRGEYGTQLMYWRNFRIYGTASSTPIFIQT
jgi:hypothetical protein